MNKVVKNGMLSVLTACLVLLPTSLVYAGGDPVSAAIPVEQEFDTENKVPDDLSRKIEYELTALDQDSPMPAGADGTSYVFTLDGDQQLNLTLPGYTHGGMYTYKLQEKVNHEEAGYHYDDAVYEITVAVKNGADGSLIPQVIAEGSEGTKLSGLSFHNSYEGEEEPVIPPTEPKTTNPPVTPKLTNNVTITNTNTFTNNKTNSNVTKTSGLSGLVQKVKTGDPHQAALWAVITAAAAAVAVMILIGRRNRKQQETE